MDALRGMDLNRYFQTVLKPCYLKTVYARVFGFNLVSYPIQWEVNWLVELNNVLGRLVQGL